MVELHIAKLLADEGFGTFDVDVKWKEMPVDADGKPLNGIWVVPRGDSVSYLDTGNQNFDIYRRDSNKLRNSQQLEAILERLRTAYGDVCNLPTVPPYSDTEYVDCVIEPTSSIDVVGTDDQDKIIEVISGNINFKIKGISQ